MGQRLKGSEFSFSGCGREVCIRLSYSVFGEHDGVPDGLGEAKNCRSWVSNSFLMTAVINHPKSSSLKIHIYSLMVLSG